MFYKFPEERKGKEGRFVVALVLVETRLWLDIKIDHYGEVVGQVKLEIAQSIWTGSIHRRGSFSPPLQIVQSLHGVLC